MPYDQDGRYYDEYDNRYDNRNNNRGNRNNRNSGNRNRGRSGNGGNGCGGGGCGGCNGKDIAWKVLCIVSAVIAACLLLCSIFYLIYILETHCDHDCKRYGFPCTGCGMHIAGSALIIVLAIVQIVLVLLLLICRCQWWCGYAILHFIIAGVGIILAIVVNIAEDKWHMCGYYGRRDIRYDNYYNGNNYYNDFCGAYNATIGFLGFDIFFSLVSAIIVIILVCCGCL